MPVWIIGAMTSPVLMMILIGVFPVTFVRLAGCTGDLDGVELHGRQLIVGEHVFMSGKRSHVFDVQKVTVQDPATGDVVAGPWVHPMRGWVGTMGEMYCVA